MTSVNHSVELVREYLEGGRVSQVQAQAAFRVVLDAYAAIGEMLHAAMEREHDAELALSVLRHPSESQDQLKQTLRRLANLEDAETGEPISQAFEQVMDELIAEVRWECGTPVGPRVGMAERTM